MGRFGQDRFAGMQWSWNASEEIFRPRPECGFVMRECGNERARIQKVNHRFPPLIRAMARRTFAFVGGGTTISRDPMCFSHGERARASTRWRTALRT